MGMVGSLRTFKSKYLSISRERGMGWDLKMAGNGFLSSSFSTTLFTSQQHSLTTGTLSSKDEERKEEEERR